MSTVEIKNMENDFYISALLDIVSTFLEAEQLDVVKNKKVIPGTKGMIITGICIATAGGVAAALITEAIKYALKKLKNREDYRQESKIEINGNVYIIKDIKNLDIS